MLLKYINNYYFLYENSTHLHNLDDNIIIINQINTFFNITDQMYF